MKQAQITLEKVAPSKLMVVDRQVVIAGFLYFSGMLWCLTVKITAATNCLGTTELFKFIAEVFSVRVNCIVERSLTFYTPLLGG